jgi:hypothetical protein
MKSLHKQFFIILILGFSTLTVHCQVVKSDIRGSKEKSLTIIGKDTLLINANIGDQIEAVFVVENNWLDDHFIAQVQTDCHCITALFPEKINRLKTDSITVVLNTQNIPPGPFIKRAYLETPDDDVIHLVIMGNLKLVRPVIKQGQPPQIYKPKHIRWVSNKS